MTFFWVHNDLNSCSDVHMILFQISSQNDYLLKYVKPPHVYSVDYSNLTAVEEVLKKIQSTMVPLLFSSNFIKL